MECECREDFASGFIAESPAKLWQRLCPYFAALAGRGEFAPVECNAPWVSPVIESDGTVQPCFFQRPQLGNVRAGNSLEVVRAAEEAMPAV